MPKQRRMTTIERENCRIMRADLLAALDEAGVKGPFDIPVWMYGDYSTRGNSFHFALQHNGHLLFIGYMADQEPPFLVREFPSERIPLVFFRSSDGHSPSNTRKFPEIELHVPAEVAKAVVSWPSPGEAEQAGSGQADPPAQRIHVIIDLQDEDEFRSEDLFASYMEAAKAFAQALGEPKTNREGAWA